MPDGIHLTPVSGLHYVLHLFDQSESALQTSTLSVDQELASVKESVRQHDDRMAYLEGRQGGFVSQAHVKVAADAELHDWMLNRADEDWMVVTNLPRISSNRDWQDAARRQVADVIKLVLHANRINMNFEVMYVANPFRFQTNRQNVYNVQMDSVSSAKRIRDVFSGFFRGRRPVNLPPPLKGVSIRNKVTPSTKIRISILHQLGSIYTETNQGASYKVQGFVSRPLLITFPPQGSAGHQRTYTFMQAVSMLPATFSDDHLIRIYQVVSGQHPGNLQPLFVVLNDDDRERCLELVKQKRSSNQGHSMAPSGAGVMVGSFSGAGSGMEVQGSGALSVDDLRRAPPPPPADRDPEVVKAHRSGKKKTSQPSSESPALPVKERGKSSDDKDRDKSSDDKERDTGKTKVREKHRDTDRDKSKTGVKRRHRSSSSSSSSSSSDQSRKRSKKKSKKSKSKSKPKHRRRRRSPTPSSSSSSGSSTASGSGASVASASASSGSRTRDPSVGARSERSERSRSRER